MATGTSLKYLLVYLILFYMLETVLHAGETSQKTHVCASFHEAEIVLWVGTG